MPIVPQDQKYGIRVLPRAAGTAAAAVLSMALGLGAILARPGGLQAQPVDTKGAAAAIMQADRDFNQAVASRDRQKFLSLVAETAVFVANAPMRGHDEILEGWAPFFEPNGPTLTWEPASAYVLVAGDVGVTIGNWVRRGRGADGKPAEARGQYTTTWQKQKDGSWKAVFDIGSTAP